MDSQQRTNLITAVAVIKNRDRQRAENFISSLKNQTIPCDIIVVDFGSDDISWYDEVFKDVILIRVTRDTKDFNKSRALNIGFKAAKTKYIISTDIDNKFALNFVEEILNALKTPKTVVLCRRWDTNSAGQEIELHSVGAYGVCFAIEREWMMKVHGYDEFYTYWGKEDDDIFHRAVQDGYNPVWIHNKTKIIHQWHPVVIHHTLTQNEEYFKIPNKPLIRNKDKWGKL